ncbi:hypothetical protein JOD64_003155 [Micromonospora luteifusca]|uniref:Uncharacterized protein n=1 Tax=Micromonospora luteifusca TaxID=709860 RepID=A0ABS2LVS8_9ACTN|nr:hypothetical protein [Micromonospora luteifusca]
MSFHARGLGNWGRHGWGAWDIGIRRVAAGCPHPWSSANPGHRGRQARPCWAGKRIQGTGIAAGAIESRWDVARISDRKAAQHLRRRVQRSGRKAALACSTSARVAPSTDTSTRRDPSPRRDGRCGRTFCTSVKAALDGPYAPPPGRAPAPAAVALRPSRLTPGDWRGQREARRAAARRQGVGNQLVGRQPAGARRPSHRRVVGRVTAGRGGDAARSVRVRPSKVKGASRRCATALRAALYPGASATPRAGVAGRPGACPGYTRRIPTTA